MSLVTQWFPPEPVQQPEWLADALGEQGWDVTVLTGIPNYPDGEVQDGFRAWEFRRETLNGRRVRRTPLYPSHDGSAAGRVFNYLSWAVTASVGGLGDLRRSDVALVYSSPATAALPAMAARALARRPFVLMIQDLWPDSIFASGFMTGGFTGRIAKTGLGGFSQLAYRMASSIAVISPGMRDLLIERGVSPEKVHLVYNWVDESLFHPAERDPQLRSSLGIASDDFVLMYAGNHGAAQDLANVVQAIGLVTSERKIHLILVGDGVEKATLQELAHHVAPRRIHFLDPRPPSAMAPVMDAADFQLVSLRDDPLFHITMPSKVQAILASGQPILVSAPGDAARVAVNSGAGLAVAPGDPQALAEAIQDAALLGPDELNQLGSKASHYYHEHMAERIGVAQLSALLLDAATSGKRDRQ